jgi:acyl-CoA synthetase (AMP-forming)/AMP-acid ligase II
VTGLQSTRIGDWLRVHARERPDDVYVVDGGNDRELSYSEVHDRVSRLASSLAALGIGPGDRVAVMSVDSHRFIEVLLASMTMGATIVPFNTRLVEAEVTTFLTASAAKVLFLDARSFSRMSGIGAAVPTLEKIVALDPDSPAQLHLEDLIASGSPAFVPGEVDDEDILRLSFTSGTTGKPKGVLQSHRMLKNLGIQCTIDRGFTTETFHYDGSPLYHIGGFSHLLTSLAVGYRILTLPAFDAETLTRWMSDRGLTHAFLVPTMVSTMLQLPGIADRDFSAFQSMGYGAAPMPPALLRRAIDTFGCDFLQLFGSSEAGSQTVLGHEHHRRALQGQEHLLGSIGKAAFGTEVRICDENLRDVAPGDVGEIVTKGDVLMSGYLDQPDETSAVVRDGWLRSGDMGRRDAEGFVYLAGRKKDMIIRGGENIYPIEIETVLSNFPGVLDAAVVGKPDEHWGEVVVACLVVDWDANREEEREEELRLFARERLAHHKVPTLYLLRDSLPTNSIGKIDKIELRAIAAETSPAV